MTWSPGLRIDSADERRARLLELWELSPKDEPLRDVDDGVIYEVAGGTYQRIADPAPIFAAIAAAGTYASWANVLAGDFHECVKPVGVPFLLRVDVPDAQYVRDQASWLMIDEESELLDRHGLSPDEAYALNRLVNALADLSIDHGLVMTYG